MANKKKTTDLSGLFKTDAVETRRASGSVETDTDEQQPAIESKKRQKKTINTTVYVPPGVYEQWRQLAFEERKKMHDYLMEGLDMVFRNRGLKSVAELTGEK
jgi:hypothetical protein